MKRWKKVGVGTLAGLVIFSGILSYTYEKAYATTQGFTFSESANQTQTQVINLPKLKSVTSVTSNTGNATVTNVNGDNVTLQLTSGASSRAVQTGGSAAANKTETYSSTSSTNSFAASVPYNDGSYVGTLTKLGGVVTTSVPSGGYYADYGHYESYTTSERDYFEYVPTWTVVGMDCYWTNNDHVNGTYKCDYVYGYEDKLVWYYKDVVHSVWVVDGSNWVTTYVNSYTQNYSGTVYKPDTRTYQYYYTYTVTVNYVDNTAPELAVLDNSQTVSTAAGYETITISGTVSDVDNNDVVLSATLNGKTKTVLVTGTRETKNWSLEWNVNKDMLDAGLYTSVNVQSDDGMSGITTKVYTGSILVDKTAPVLQVDFDEILDEQIYSYIAKNKLNFSGSVSEDNAKSKVSVYYYIENSKTNEKGMVTDLLAMEKENDVSHTPFSSRYRIDSKLASGTYQLVVYAANNVGLKSVQTVPFEIANLTSGPSVSVSVYPQPTGKWENSFLDVYVTDSGDFDLLSKAVKQYEVTDNAFYPSHFTKELPIDRKITLDRVGVSYVHIKYTLEDSTVISTTVGPYLVDTAEIGAFDVSLVDDSGKEVIDWTNNSLKLLISDPSVVSVSGLVKQYRIENYHSDWQTYVDGTSVSLEGNNRIFARIVSSSGKISEQQYVRALIDKKSPDISVIELVSTNHVFDVKVETQDVLSGIKHVTLDGVNIASGTKQGVYMVSGLLSKPTSFIVEDAAGNKTTSHTFAPLPVVSFDAPYSIDLPVYKKDVGVQLSNGNRLSYTFGNKLYDCQAGSCAVNLSTNGLLTVINTEDNKQTKIAVDIKNINKTTLELKVKAKRNESNPNEILLDWNYNLTDGWLFCIEGGEEKTYPVSGFGYVLSGKNVTYDCYIKGTYGGEEIISSRVIIYPDVRYPVENEIGIDKTVVDTNIFIEESRFGTSYFINAKSDNYKKDEIPLPKNSITSN